MLVDSCLGLQFLHSKSIAHRDLSSNNILLTKHLVAKIADLGMAKVMSGDAGQKHTMAPGTQVFMPPETLEGTNEAIYGITIDVFSLGCICLHVISMQWPVLKPVKRLDDTTGRIVALTELERREQYLTAVFQQFLTLKALVCQCLHDFPKKRPAVGAVLEGLRAVYRDVVPRENNNIIQLCNYYKTVLQQKDQELVQKNDQLKCKEKEFNEKDKQLNIVAQKFEKTLEEKKQLTAKLLEVQKQLALNHKELAKAKEQLIMKDQQLIKIQKNLEELQFYPAVLQQQQQQPSSMLPSVSIPTTMNKHLKIVSPETMKEVSMSKIPLAPQDAVSADNDSGEDDEPQDREDNLESDNEVEEGELDDKDDDYEDEDEDGRQRRYERDFLLSLQFLEQCTRRPSNLMMNAEYIRKLPRPLEMGFNPGYYDNMGPMGSRKRGLYQRKTTKMDLSTKEPVELRKADKRWVRPAEQEADLAKAEKETQELFRKYIGLLNKLTPQKFETLANQALEMPINSEDRLKGCVDKIFIKAIEEPNFSVVYAQLCRVLSKVSVKVGTGPDVKKKTFRSLLLTKCQQEFKKDKESDTVIAELKKKVEGAIPEERKRLEEKLREKECQVRHKYLGNIKFIGELFKLKMLSEGIMHECIRRLLQSTTDEEALECAAKLMFTIGKDLDHEKGQALIKQYMDRIELISNARKISPRIKFILQDLVELRNV